MKMSWCTSSENAFLENRSHTCVQKIKEQSTITEKMQNALPTSGGKLMNKDDRRSPNDEKF